MEDAVEVRRGTDQRRETVREIENGTETEKGERFVIAKDLADHGVALGTG